MLITLPYIFFYLQNSGRLSSLPDSDSSCSNISNTDSGRGLSEESEHSLGGNQPSPQSITSQAPPQGYAPQLQQLPQKQPPPIPAKPTTKHLPLDPRVGVLPKSRRQTSVLDENPVTNGNLQTGVSPMTSLGKSPMTSIRNIPAMGVQRQHDKKMYNQIDEELQKQPTKSRVTFSDEPTVSYLNNKYQNPISRDVKPTEDVAPEVPVYDNYQTMLRKPKKPSGDKNNSNNNHPIEILIPDDYDHGYSDDVINMGVYGSKNSCYDSQGELCDSSASTTSGTYFVDQSGEWDDASEHAV